MPDNELSVHAEVGLGGLSPIHAKLAAGYTARWNARGEGVVAQIVDAVGDSGLILERLEANEELDALFVRAAMAGAESAFAEKRKLLAAAVGRAILDDAEIDEACLLVDLVTQIETVHARALEAIHRAEVQAKEAGDIGVVAYGAEKPLSQQVHQAIDATPEPVLRKLLSLGLLDASINWDGSTHSSGVTAMGANLLADLHATGGGRDKSS